MYLMLNKMDPSSIGFIGCRFAISEERCWADMVDSVTFILTTAIIYYPPAPTPDEKNPLTGISVHLCWGLRPKH